MNKDVDFILSDIPIGFMVTPFAISHRNDNSASGAHRRAEWGGVSLHAQGDDGVDARGAQGGDGCGGHGDYRESGGGDSDGERVGGGDAVHAGGYDAG